MSKCIETNKRNTLNGLGGNMNTKIYHASERKFAISDFRPRVACLGRIMQTLARFMRLLSKLRPPSRCVLQ